MLITVIIPCYNSIETIDRAVKSVFAQTWKNWELILINNNSTDCTFQKLLDIQKSNPSTQITVLDEKKIGAPAARNKGLYEAKGEWIQFLDADDELLPEKIEIQMEAITENIDVIYSPYQSITINKNAEKRHTSEIEANNIWKALFVSKIGITSSNLWRKSKIIQAGGWDERCTSSQDAHLSFSLLKVGARFLSLNKILTNVYAVENSITRNRSKAKVKLLIHNFIDLRVRIIHYLQFQKLYTNEYSILFNRFFADCYIWYFSDFPTYVFSQYNLKTNDKLIDRMKTNYIFMCILIKSPIKVFKNLF